PRAHLSASSPPPELPHARSQGAPGYARGAKEEVHDRGRPGGAGAPSEGPEDAQAAAPGEDGLPLEEGCAWSRPIATWSFVSAKTSSPISRPPGRCRGPCRPPPPRRTAAPAGCSPAAPGSASGSGRKDTTAP